MAVAAALLVALAGLAIWWYPRAQPPAEPVAFTIDAPEGSSLATGPALMAMSPDGRKIALITGSADTSQLWVRPIGSLVAQRLDRTAGAWQPYWSLDSRSLAFSGSGGSLPLRRIDASGGAPTMLVESVRERGAWGAGVVVFTGLDSRLYRVADTGGAATLLMDFDSTRQEVALTWPTFLPDGRRFVFLARSSDRAKSALFLASVDKPGRTHLVDALSNVEYAAGYLFYMRDGTLYAHPFDERAGRITGEAFQVVESIRYNPANGRGAFSVSATGVLAYVSGESTLDTTREILRFDRFGKRLGSIGAAGTFSHARLSPDGRRIVAVEENRQEQNRILWLMDVDRGAPIRFTVGTVDEGDPVWAPDGAAVVFASVRPDARGIFRRAAGGGATTDELIFASPDEPVVPTGFSPQGDVLLFNRGSGSRRRIWALPVRPLGAARDSSPKPIEVFPGSTTVDTTAVFSPDGKWIAYMSYNPSSVETAQVFLQPYPPDGRRILVSPTTGFNPQWTADQKQIVYRTVDDALMAVTIPLENGTPKPGAPQTLFTQPRAARFNWSFTMNGASDQFVLVVPPPKAQQEPQPAVPITVIVNWAQSLKRK
jgi:Tol biopolymer transport system component